LRAIKHEFGTDFFSQHQNFLQKKITCEKKFKIFLFGSIFY
jgi:hypothetical protein